MIILFPTISLHQTDSATPILRPDSPSLQKQQTFDASAKSKANRGGLALHYFRAVLKSALL